MRYAVLGGSFNPVHMGHLFLADTVLSKLDYGRVILVPAFQSPFKIRAEGASPEDRMEMLAASISGDPRLTIDDCEIRRQGVSYTIDTIADIIARYRPEGKPALILGDDLASAFHKWRKPDAIAELADIIIARRIPAGSPAAFPYPSTALDNEIMDLSSRLVREKICRGENWRFLVPQGARQIIEDRRLYGFTGDGDSALAEISSRLENEVRAVLNPARYSHSRNTALLARDLCRRFGADPQKGYLAGIVHDICKAQGEKELIRLAHHDGKGLSQLEKKKPGLLHARAAAVLMKEKYGITDREILEAIQLHTTGARDMGVLAKIVYIADKIEISRTGVDPALRDMAASADLDAFFSAVLDNTVTYLRSRELEISTGTKRLLAAMRGGNDT